MEKILAKIETYILYVVVFLFPVTVLSISPNPFVVPKLAVLVYGVLLLLLIKSVRIIYLGRLDFFIGNFDFSVFLIGISFLISAMLKTPNKMEAFLLPGTATAVIGGMLIYFIINQLRKEEKEILSKILVLSAAFFSIITLFAFGGVLAKIPQLPAYYKSLNFTPEGGYLPAIIFLGVTTLINLSKIFSEKNTSQKVIFGIALGLTLLTLVISIYNVLPGRSTHPRFLSFSSSWFIAVDALKESPLFGIGPGNYLTAFNRFRPVSYNKTDLWAIKFSTARSFYLTSLTEAGIVFFAGITLLLLSIYKLVRQDLKEKKLVNWGFAAISSQTALILLAVIFLFMPATTLLIALFFILLALNAKTHQTSLPLTTISQAQNKEGFDTKTISSRFPAFLLTLPVIVAVILLGYKSSQVLAAEYKFTKALEALNRNDAVKTYDTMRESLKLNPKVDRYHATLARINVALANSYTQKKEITNDDRNTITILIQQAINEAKASVALNPLRSGNWEILAQTYRSIIPLAKGADDFTIQTLRQAIALDPINPNLRIQLGGVYYAKGDYKNASRVFELAVAAKQDHANARYNLAFALKEDGEIDKAVQQMTIVLSLIEDKNSKDYQIAKQALEDFQSKTKVKTPTQEGSELTPPEKAPEPVITPPIELPEEAEPPEAPLSSTPTPSPTPIQLP